MNIPSNIGDNDVNNVNNVNNVNGVNGDNNVNDVNGVNDVNDVNNVNNVNNVNDEREGLIDIIKNGVKDIAAPIATSLTDNILLKPLGLERINKTPEDMVSSQKFGEMVSTGKNVANNMATTAIQNVNEVLGSDLVQGATREAAENTANIIKQSAETINAVLNKPDVKEKVKEAAKNLEFLAEAANGPIEKFGIDIGNSLQQVIPKAVTAGTKAVLDAALISPIGPLIEASNMINDATKAASAFVEAGSQAVESASDMFAKTTDNYNKLMNELEEKKRLANQISNRTTQSINQFENPLVQTGGGRKTKRRLLNRRAKSKRVRFAF